MRIINDGDGFGESSAHRRALSKRIPAGVYISINVDSRRRWKSAISVLSSEESAAWGDAVTLHHLHSQSKSGRPMSSYEADRILGSGEVIGKIQLSWHQLLDRGVSGDEPFSDVHPSLTLKVAVVHACDDALSDSFIDCKIARDTDAGHARFAAYVTSGDISQLNIAVEHFQLRPKPSTFEVIHLAAGLQCSGFKSVVGTLWEVDDAVANYVVEAFYTYMFHLKEVGVMDPTKAAWALNCATHAVKTKMPLEQRMIFIHIGV
ncbi:hypothetical protein BDR05DRAFT_1000361 [Suillus weaverae]|nr:hypothetical protein BDR05DRAFT_1000361 [Suillus weaverae]